MCWNKENPCSSEEKSAPKTGHTQLWATGQPSRGKEPTHYLLASGSKAELHRKEWWEKIHLDAIGLPSMCGLETLLALKFPLEDSCRALLISPNMETVVILPQVCIRSPERAIPLDIDSQIIKPSNKDIDRQDVSSARRTSIWYSEQTFKPEGDKPSKSNYQFVESTWMEEHDKWQLPRCKSKKQI